MSNRFPSSSFSCPLSFPFSLSSSILLAFALLAGTGCGGDASGSSDGQTDVASADSTAAASALSVGHWELSGASEVGSAVWIADVVLADNGTFRGIIGCGLSDCSGHQVTAFDGTYALHHGGVSFTYEPGEGAAKRTDTYASKAGTNGMTNCGSTTAAKIRGLR